MANLVLSFFPLPNLMVSIVPETGECHIFFNDNVLWQGDIYRPKNLFFEVQDLSESEVICVDLYHVVTETGIKERLATIGFDKSFAKELAKNMLTGIPHNNGQSH